MTKLKTSARSLRQRRERMRAEGLRSIRLWVPDTRRSGFASDCDRQSHRIVQSVSTAADDDAWFEASDRTGWS